MPQQAAIICHDNDPKPQQNILSLTLGLCLHVERFERRGKRCSLEDICAGICRKVSRVRR